MAIWHFLDYIEASGRNPITSWVAGLPFDAQAAIDGRLLAMEGLRKWPEKWASSYVGLDGIIEIRIPFNRVQYRPLGMYSPVQRMAFVLLCGAIEKGGKIAKSDLKTAERRRQEILAEPSRVKPHHF